MVKELIINLPRFYRKDFSIKLSDESGELKGVLEQPYNKTSGEITSAYIESVHRGIGDGKRMLLAAEKVFKDYGIKIVYLQPTIESEKFWRKMGYQEEPKLGRYYIKILITD